MSQLTSAKLEKLKAEVPHCGSLKGFPSDYLTPFAQPLPESACLCCGARGSFTWGLAHGEGHCHDCGWPARLYHFVKDADGKEQRIVGLLQYHPDGISLRSNAP